MVIKVNYRLFLFPPWYVYHLIKNSIVKFERLKFLDYFFIGWVVCQWLLIFFSSKNILVNIISANLAIIGFLVGNIYLQLDTSKYSLNDQKFLRSVPLKVLIALGTIAFLYLFANLPNMVLRGLEEYIGTDIISDSFLWTFYHSIIGYILMLFWFIFVTVTKYKKIDVFPRSNEKIWPCKLGKSGKLLIILFYLVVILFFYDFLIKGYLVHLSTNFK